MGMNRELLDDFLLESRERIDRLEASLLALEDASIVEAEHLLETIRLDLHTLKGNAGLIGLAEMQSLSHAMEDEVADLEQTDAAAVQSLLQDVDRLRSLLQEAGGPDEASPGAAAPGDGHLGGVRLGFAQLDRLVDLVGEMVIFRNRLSDTLGAGMAEVSADLRESVGRAHDELFSTLSRLRDEILRLRMIPLGTLFRSLHRIAHDESVRVGKRVELETAGGETPLDRALLELASEALGHLVREPSADRESSALPGSTFRSERPQQPQRCSQACIAELE